MAFDRAKLAELEEKLVCGIFPKEQGLPETNFEGEGSSASPSLSEEEKAYLGALERELSGPLDLSCLSPHGGGEAAEKSLLSRPPAGDSDTEKTLLSRLLPLDEDEIERSRTRDEYLKFQKAVKESHLLALLFISRELKSFDPASHTIGVHNVALKTGEMARKAGIPVDLALLSAAAFGHDIGKFGCRGEDAARVPYLHYYYTRQWFHGLGLDEIGHISANHSTWDLEFENLTIESLLLIYADFRVRGVRGKDGREEMHVCSLKDSYDMILSKLANVDEEKRKRYKSVYFKLRDFENFLREAGVPEDLDSDELLPIERKDASLMSAEEALSALKSMALSHSVSLMRMVSESESFMRLLEQAKNEKNSPRIRTYLNLFDEYSTYMSAEGKRNTLAFLYELLMHPEGDVRRNAGRIMGKILANSGPKYRKERPKSAKDDIVTPAMAELLSESLSLWENYIERFLHPDVKVSAKHARRIANSLKTVAGSLFSACDDKEVEPLLLPLLCRFEEASGDELFTLCDALSRLPLERLSVKDRDRIERRLKDILAVTEKGEALSGDALSLPLLSLRFLRRLSGEGEGAYRTSERKLLGIKDSELDSEEISDIYLSDLKLAVHWSQKISQIDVLKECALREPEGSFHSAMHLSNLLSVSEHLPVREHAGEALLEIVPRLSVAQKNEIAIDLLRELESGQEQISRFIPPYLGKIINMLPDKEFNEAVEQLSELVHGSSARPARVALYTLGETLKAVFEGASSTGGGKAVISGGQGEEESSTSVSPIRDKDAAANKLLGCLMKGASHYKDTIHRTALSVLCREIFGSSELPLETRKGFFALLHKKLLAILSEPGSEELSFFSRAAMLNHLYRFIVEAEVESGGFSFPERKPAAFFPGTFDPFSLGHKRIVEEIRDQGFEVYLAIDEFSWSKKTLARKMRRRIALMSTADEWDTYIFPDDIPVNIAIAEDLAQLKGIFGSAGLYIAAGSDVIKNASAYRNTEPGSAREYDHIIFCRDTGEGGKFGGDAKGGSVWPSGGRSLAEVGKEEKNEPVVSKEEKDELESVLRGKIIFLRLPPFFESVSSTRIRASVDRDLDISMLVDPIVQSFIYEAGFYVRAPEKKRILARQDMYFRFLDRETARKGLSGEEFKAVFEGSEGELAAILWERPERLLGYALGHTLEISGLYENLGSVEAADFARHHISGKILLIDSVSAEKSGGGKTAARMALNELLARSLERGYSYALCRPSKGGVAGGIGISCRQLAGEEKSGERRADKEKAAVQDEALRYALDQLGFTRLPGGEDIYYVDMRAPAILLQDVLLHIKEPHRSSSGVKAALDEIRPRLRRALTGLFPGKLLLSFDSELLNQALMERIQRLNGVSDVPAGERRLGPYMCVPYGKILSGDVVDNTVTKTLHVEKRFEPDVRSFEIVESPGYSPLRTQLRTLRSFRRPVILVDDLLHKGYRMDKLDPLIREEGVEIERLTIALMSGYGSDLMKERGLETECEYFIPNLHYWVTESLLYPFIGGDSIGEGAETGLLPSINLLLPYYYPHYLSDAEDEGIWALSRVALENAGELLRALEKEQQNLFSTTLTLKNLGEALEKPRIPERGVRESYDPTLTASECIAGDLALLGRIYEKKEDLP